YRYCRWSLAATVACMPLYVVRYHVGPFPTTLLETLALITIALYVAWRLTQLTPPHSRGGGGEAAGGARPQRPTPPHSWGGGGEAAGGARRLRTPLEIPTAPF